MNSYELTQYVRELTGIYSADIVSDATILRWLNEAYNEVARDRDWDWLEDTYRAALPSWTEVDPALHFGYHQFTLPEGSRRVLSAYLVGENGTVDELVQTSDIDHVEVDEPKAKYDVTFGGTVRIVPEQDPGKSVKFRYTKANLSLENKYYINWTQYPVTIGSGEPDEETAGNFYYDEDEEVLYGPKNLGPTVWPVIGSYLTISGAPASGPFTLTEVNALLGVPPVPTFSTGEESLYYGDMQPTPVAQSPLFDSQFHSMLAYRASVKVLNFVNDDTNRAETYMNEYTSMFFGMYDMYENDHDYRTFQLGGDGVDTRKYFPWFRPE